MKILMSSQVKRKRK